MFENLTNKFEEVFSSLKKAPSLDEKQVDEGLRGIRQALLEGDVSLDVAKQFIENVKPKALGQEIIRSTSPGQMVVKIVYDELVKLLGENSSEINLSAVPPVPMMLVGLQGSGRTTTTAKLARYLEINKKKKIIACICSGAQLLISAKVVKGRKIAGYYSMQDDLVNAGAIYTDLPAVVDDNIITTAHYKDMGPWMKAVINKLS